MQSLQQYGVTGTHMQCLECSASTSNKPFLFVTMYQVTQLCLSYWGIMHFHTCMMSTVSLAQRCMFQVLAVHVCGTCSYVVQQVHLPGWLGVFCLFGLQCTYVVFLGILGSLEICHLWSLKCLSWSEVVAFCSKFCLMHSLDKLWLNGKPGFRGRCEVSSYLQSCC